MNDTVEIVLSWLIIFMVTLFAVITGEFIGQVNTVDSFHAQVNPIIEEYGGDSNKQMSDFTHNSSDTDTAQEKIDDIAHRMYVHHHIAFVVEPDTNESNNNYPTKFASNPDVDLIAKYNASPSTVQRPTKSDLHNAVTATDSGSESNAVAPFGHEINYRVYVLTPYNLGNTLLQKLFTASVKYSTVSKVGQD